MPKITFETLDQVPEWLRGDAKEVNGKIEADVVQTAKVDEFRNNNIKLSTERDALLKTNESLVALVGEDVEAFKTEIETLRKAIAHEAKGDVGVHARHCRDAIAPAMLAVRQVADQLEGIVADDLWPLPTYQEMLFIK